MPVYPKTADRSAGLIFKVVAGRRSCREKQDTVGAIRSRVYTPGCAGAGSRSEVCGSIGAGIGGLEGLIGGLVIEYVCGGECERVVRELGQGGFRESHAAEASGERSFIAPVVGCVGAAAVAVGVGRQRRIHQLVGAQPGYPIPGLHRQPRASLVLPHHTRSEFHASNPDCMHDTYIGCVLAS